MRALLPSADETKRAVSRAALQSWTINLATEGYCEGPAEKLPPAKLLTMMVGNGVRTINGTRKNTLGRHRPISTAYGRGEELVR